MYTPKQRMLNAYRGIYSDTIPVAPEFWSYYPAKVLGVDMIEFKKIPHWKTLQETFKKFGCEGWGIVGASANNPDVKEESETKKIAQGQYRSVNRVNYRGREFVSSTISTKDEPSWKESYPVKNDDELKHYLEMCLNEDITYDFHNANNAYKGVGEDYLLEFNIGDQFFDFIARGMGFEKTIYCFLSDHDELLNHYFERYVNQQKKLINLAVQKTDFEAFSICTSYSCNSLIGPDLWRKWDKPYIKAMVDEIHKHRRLLHIHLHGKILETVQELPEIGVDCVCPFERYPGDVNGPEDLKGVRKALADKVTFNGNVSTVDALIRGTPDDVRREVREIKEAFEGSSRLIIGTGDQVGRETPEENLWAMIEEARKIKTG